MTNSEPQNSLSPGGTRPRASSATTGEAALSGSIGRLIVAFAAVVGMAGLRVSPVRAAQASSELEGHGWWAEVGLGYGRVELRAQSATLHNDSLAFSFAGGLRVSPHVKVGLDLGGYNLQSTCVSTPSHLCTSSDS